MTGWGYRPELDGLRSVAVYLVLLFHAQMAWMAGGFVGVDVFFVLSGFLVTQVILTEVDDGGSLRLARFYARRVRRLLPAAVVVVLAVVATWLVVASLPQRLEIVRDAQAALVYLANWQFIAESRDYFATDTEHSPFLHFWSLSIEEQFYLFYPLTLLLLLRLGRGSQRLLLPGLGALAAVSVGLQVWWARTDEAYAYYATETRLYQLLAGAVLAVLLRARSRRRAQDDPAPGRSGGSRVAGVAGAVALVGLVLVGSGALTVSPSTRGLLAVALSVALLAALSAAPRSLTGRLLALPLPVYLGRISYGTYLWHWPVILVLAMVMEVRPLVLAAAAAVLATALAALSHEVLELPVRRAAALHRVPRAVVATGLTTSLVVALAVVPTLLADERAPATRLAARDTGGAGPDDGRLARLLERRVPPDLDFPAILADRGLKDTWCLPDRIDDCRIEGARGADFTVVLVGDSHARMITPAVGDLAREKGFQLYASIVSSCPWQKGVWNITASTQNQQQCREAREELYERTLPAMEPDLVVFATLPRTTERWQGGLVADGRQERPLHRLLAEGTAAALDAVTALGAHAVVMHSVMGTGGYDSEGWDPLDCLARADTLGDCAVYAPPRPPVVDSFYDTRATVDDQVSTVDLNQLVCPTLPVCSPLHRGEVVWRNPDHVTAAVVRAVRDELWTAIGDGGGLARLDG